MRVIAGEFRSRTLKTPPGLDVRPTPDRLRESLFSIIMPHLPGSVFADLYAGCGAAGIEAISRGARLSIFVERSRQALAVLKSNLDSLGIADRAQVIHGNASTYASSIKADIIFLDPPYDKQDEYGKTLPLLRAPLVIAQHSSFHKLAATYGALTRFREVRQGDNTLSFYKPVE
jgi:16S rRNA (guanine(966)-N(2))-methyltransferase RsmD